MSTTTSSARPQEIKLLHLQQRASLLTNLPLTTEQLAELFDYLDRRLRLHTCDDTLGHTRCFAAVHELPFEPLRQFLGRHDGYCDCEVLANVQERYETIL